MKLRPARIWLFSIFILLEFSIFPAAAENWPQWRGPHGNGTSGERGLPVRWSRTENVLWRLPLPGRAGSTPAVWDDHIFLTSAARPEDGKASADDLVLLAASTAGKVLWKRILGNGDRAVQGEEGNYASSSPATDGKRVWAMAGTGDLACYDFEGREAWKFNLQERYGKYQVQFGMTSTPVLQDEALYLQCIHSGESYVLALEKETGRERWKRVRKTDARDECEHSYASPMLYRDGDHTLLLAHGADYLTAHRLSDGEELWRIGDLNPKSDYNPTLRLIASPSCAAGLVVVPAAKGGPVHGLRPYRQGGEEKFERLWTLERNTPDVPTPAIHEGLVYLLRENGVLICLDARDGKEVYQERTHIQRHRASPVVADGKVYCAAADGTVTVVKAGRRFEVLAANALGESLTATPVTAGGKLYLRTYQALYCIQESAGKESSGQ
ncbi:MAG: PQQ-like beta-propeller repeat protein [Planctomycetes bacterium]|nr:PQQ-like beta-propeller repeat protein [Planctomycetota bacterium]